MMLDPAQFLGLPVLDAQGTPVGEVADVGLAAWNQPKFLLVRLRQDARLVRVEFAQVAAVGPEVRLAAPLPPPPSAAPGGPPSGMPSPPPAGIGGTLGPT